MQVNFNDLKNEIDQFFDNKPRIGEIDEFVSLNHKKLMGLIPAHMNLYPALSYEHKQHLQEVDKQLTAYLKLTTHLMERRNSFFDNIEEGK